MFCGWILESSSNILLHWILDFLRPSQIEFGVMQPRRKQPLRREHISRCYSYLVTAIFIVCQNLCENVTNRSADFLHRSLSTEASAADFQLQYPLHLGPSRQRIRWLWLQQGD